MQELLGGGDYIPFSRRRHSDASQMTRLLSAGHEDRSRKWARDARDNRRRKAKNSIMLASRLSGFNGVPSDFGAGRFGGFGTDLTSSCPPSRVAGFGTDATRSCPPGVGQPVLQSLSEESSSMALMGLESSLTPMYFGNEKKHPQNPAYTMISSEDPGTSMDVPLEKNLSSGWSLSRLAEKRDPALSFEDDADDSWLASGRRCVKSLPAQAVMAILIIGNAVVLGFEADSPDSPLWNNVEHVFLALFLLELFFRCAVIGPDEFFDPDGMDFHWNMLDTVVVLLGVLDFAMHMCLWVVTQGTEEDDTTDAVLRIIRLLRILRIFRIVRFLRQLYLLAFGFGLAAVAVFWVTVLMTFVLYLCSVIMVRTVGSVGPSDSDFELLHVKYGCIYSAMLTLFQMLLAPDISPYYDTVWDHPFLALFLLGFIMFGSFGMIAVLTGVIMESMFEKNELRKEEERNDLDRRRTDLVTQCKRLFKQMPVDGKHEVTRDSVEMLLPAFAKIFEQHGVIYARDDLDIMLDVMDADGNGSISEAEFLHFMLQMAEGVRPMLIMELFYNTNIIQSRVVRQEVILEAIYSKVEQLVTGELQLAGQQQKQADNTDSILARGNALQERVRQHMTHLEASQKSCTQLVTASLQELQARLKSIGGSLAEGASHAKAEALAAAQRELEHKEFRAALASRVEELLGSIQVLKLGTSVEPALSGGSATLSVSVPAAAPQASLPSGVISQGELQGLFQGVRPPDQGSATPRTPTGSEAFTGRQSSEPPRAAY